MSVMFEFPDTERFLNGRPKKCPVCGNRLIRHGELLGWWVCEGLAYPTDDRLPLQSCPYFYDSVRKTELVEEPR